jgi:hypothetical protein
MGRWKFGRAKMGADDDRSLGKLAKEAFAMGLDPSGMSSDEIADMIHEANGISTRRPEIKPEPEADPMLADARRILAIGIGKEAAAGVVSLQMAAEMLETSLVLMTMGEYTTPATAWLESYRALSEAAPVAVVETAEEEVVANPLSFSSSVKELRAAAKAANIRGRSRMNKAQLCVALGIPVPEPKETNVGVIERARKIVKAASGMSVAERIAWLATPGNGAPMEKVVKVMRHFPGAAKDVGYVPGYRLHYHRRSIDEETGEVVVDQVWTSKTCRPRLWMNQDKTLRIGLIPEAPAS